MYLTAHAAERVAQHFPSRSEADVFSVISSGGVTVSGGLVATGRWQVKEYLLFWLDDQPWVAVIDLASGACLTVIKAWRDGFTQGIKLYEEVDGKKVFVVQVMDSHVRRAIRVDAGRRGVQATIPPRFQSRNRTVSARVLYRNGRVQVVRLGKYAMTAEEVAIELVRPGVVEAWREQLRSRVGDEPVREAMLSVSCGSHDEPQEVPLIESPSSGGW